MVSESLFIRPRSLVRRQPCHLQPATVIRGYKSSFDKSNNLADPPPMLNSQVRRLLDAYPAIYLACHRQHLRENEGGKVITERQASVLNHLHATRPTSLSKLAEHMGVGRSTMSITATRLTREGYIARCRDKHDGRSVGLTLTSAGVRIKEQNTVLDAELMKEMFLLMPSRELEIALHGIESLAKYAKILLRRRSRGRRP